MVLFMSQALDRSVDLDEALRLRYVNGLTEPQIADKQGVSKQAINQALKPFKHLFKDSQASNYVRDNYSNVLNMVNGQLLLQMVDPKRLKDKKLTLNQLAFSQSSIDRQLRLEAGKPSDITAHAVAVKDLEQLKGKALALVSQLRAGKREERRE